MAWSTAGRNARAEAQGALIANVSLHTGDPGGAGTSNEWTGGGYSRQAPSFGSATAGVITDDLDFTGPSEETAAWIGLWGTGPTFLGSAERTGGDGAANVAGEYGLTISLDSTGTITA